MRRLNKSTVALTFKFDCDRFLRFRLASEAERARDQIPSDQHAKRPGIQLVQFAGVAWETDRYDDLINSAPEGQVAFALKDEDDPDLGRPRYTSIPNVFELLAQDEPPLAIIEGEFQVPEDLSPTLRSLYRQYNLEPVRVRPDILWVRRAPTGAPLIDEGADDPEFELHVIDVKMAAEPSLRHFVEVTYYALALAAAIRQHGLEGRYRVSAQGLVWPGTHEVDAFRTLVREAQAEGAADPLTAALEATLVGVPYEIYRVHVHQFFEERLPRVLAGEPLEVDWHVSPRCQLCDFLPYCREQAEAQDHLSRVPWLNGGQAQLLRHHGMETTQALRQAIEAQSPAWSAAISASHQLKADAGALAVRALAMASGQPEFNDRSSSLVPKWSDQRILLTLHFDPGSGLSFAMGALRVLFEPGRAPGDPPRVEHAVFITDAADSLDPRIERTRFMEFAQTIYRWLDEISEYNQGRDRREQLSSHFYLWDKLEVTQLKRMIARHLGSEEVVDQIELLARMFPPEDQLPDPQFFRAQPGTVVKEAMRLLVGLPIPHDYTLIETANRFFPGTMADGRPYQYSLKFGFRTALSDQIPFERAYELWHNRVFLRRQEDPALGGEGRQRYYTRDEIYEELRNTVLTRLRALDHVVGQLQRRHKDHLKLRKEGFLANPARQLRLPMQARSLVAFQWVDAAAREIENRQLRALPVEEREARFHSMRGLQPVSGEPYDAVIQRLAAAGRGRAAEMGAFSFSPSSVDARVREGDFLLALSNESLDHELDEKWRYVLGLEFQEAHDLARRHGLDGNRVANRRLMDLVQVTLEAMDPIHGPPYVVLRQNLPALFQFAVNIDLLDLEQPMVLDPFYRDFFSGDVEAVLRTVGGQSAPIRRRRRR